MGFRFFVLNIFFVLLFLMLGFNLYQLQVEQGDYYLNKVQARVEYQAQQELRRGQIFFTDRNENDIPVALNRDYPMVYAVPQEITTPAQTAALVAPLTDFSEEALTESFSNTKSLFKLLIDKAGEITVQTLQEQDIEGIYIGEKQHRYYPFEQLGAQVLGFVGVNEHYPEPTGLYGLEDYYNTELYRGDDVHLTIDRNIQAEAESILSELVEEFEAAAGTIIIEHPASGAIMAMANAPQFDPNSYGEYPIDTFSNRAVEHVYEAGSVFKPLTMATGIDIGVITPDTTYVDTGSVTLNGRTIHNWDHEAYGEISMTRVIERSINTGAVFAAQQIGRKQLVTYFEKFGFGETTGIDAPQEVSGSLANLTKHDSREIDLATASFGQGTAVTPIQLINAYAAVANGGLLMRPYINEEQGPYVKRRVIQKETAEQVTGMMESAVEKAIIGAIQGYRVAGKTGTAQIPDFENGGYAEEYIHTFVGFAPVTNPRFVMLIKLDRPSVELAGQTVVPAFRELAQFVLNYYHIPPDNLQDGTE